MSRIRKTTDLPVEMKDMTIGQLVNECDEFSVKGNTLTMKKVTTDGIFSVEYKNYAGVSSIRQMKAPQYQEKKDYRQAILEMKNEGMTQKEIANALDISQSYVSQLLRK